jgi:hypothetical protein
VNKDCKGEAKYHSLKKVKKKCRGERKYKKQIKGNKSTVQWLTLVPELQALSQFRHLIVCFILANAVTLTSNTDSYFVKMLSQSTECFIIKQVIKRPGYLFCFDNMNYEQ